MDNKKKPIFIIAQKYYRGHVSYVKHYVENILEFYGENCKIIIVDNNSNYPEDIWETLPKNKNIILLTNDIECKFELGAYQVGINYVIENNLLDHYDYYVCTQDNFIIKNKLDFNSLFNEFLINNSVKFDILNFE
jgi:rRNA-processing protein FCF1